VSVEDSAVFTEVMEHQLKNTDVLNLGVNGYGPVQEYLLLQEWFPKINPDIVIVVVYMRNDFDDNMGGDWLYPRPVADWDSGYSEVMIKPPPPQPSDTRIHESVLSLCRTSHFYSLLSKRLDVLIDKHTRDEDAEHQRSRLTPPELYLCRREQTPATRLLYRTMRVVLSTIAEYAAERNVPLVFVAAPSFLQVNDDLWFSTLEEFGEEAESYDASLPNSSLMQFARNSNLAMIDLLPILRTEVKRGNQVYNIEQQHWNVEGNRVVSDALLAYLRTAGLVDTVSD
jgi:hypothetical protein